MPVHLSDLKNRSAALLDGMVSIRRHLHRNPEVSYQEHDTTTFILEELKKLGIPTERPLETGCVGVIEGKKPGPVIALRADIDALAMDEEGDVKRDFMSRRPGAAHCCGHDAHTSNLIGAASLLTEFSEHLEGKVVLIFQPAEEKLPGGGRLLCETGYLQKAGVEAIYGLHTSPYHKTGTVAFREGPLMARPDEFEIELVGKGGHAAYPHMAIDPIVMASATVMQLQTVVSRSVDPAEPAVVTVGKIGAGSAHNVIPAKANLLGTVRTFSKETANQIRERMEQIVSGVARAHGGEYRFQFNEGYPAVVNDSNLSEKFRKTASDLMGDKAVIEMAKPVMAGEDFAFYQQHFPGLFFFLGSGSEESDSQWSWHHPRYNVDENCFLVGAPLLASLALNI
ncbi:MAG: amidohydrolase [Balneolaceae bacterium]